MLDIATPYTHSSSPPAYVPARRPSRARYADAEIATWLKALTSEPELAGGPEPRRDPRAPARRRRASVPALASSAARRGWGSPACCGA